MSTSLILLRSRPPRGIIMRCREGGAGCGTRERDATHVTSPGGTREASPRHKDRGPVRLAVNAKAERCRVARREDADARVMCVRVPAFWARPFKRAGLAKSRPCAFSARHSPHLGEGKETGPPRARPKSGAGVALATRSCRDLPSMLGHNEPRLNEPRLNKTCRQKRN